MAHVVRRQPRTLQELKVIVEDFAANMKEEDVRKMTSHTRRRAELCRDQQVGHLWLLL
jgi:DNA-directed RNA polymerase subunit F